MYTSEIINYIGDGAAVVRCTFLFTPVWPCAAAFSELFFFKNSFKVSNKSNTEQFVSINPDGSDSYRESKTHRNIHEENMKREPGQQNSILY